MATAEHGRQLEIIKTMHQMDMGKQQAEAAETQQEPQAQEINET